MVIFFKGSYLLEKHLWIKLYNVKITHWYDVWVSMEEKETNVVMN